jgi:hypothetical protein
MATILALTDERYPQVYSTSGSEYRGTNDLCSSAIARFPSFESRCETPSTTIIEHGRILPSVPNVSTTDAAGRSWKEIDDAVKL